jgi:hypothetical protein
MSLQQKEKNLMNSGANTMDSAKDTANKATDFAKEAVSTVGNKVSEAGSFVADKASDVGSYISHKADDATCAVGSGLKSVAGTIREKAPHEGMIGNAATMVAGSLDTAGRELQEHGLGGIADDITNTVRRHPVPSVLIGIGLGFLLARMVSK